MKTYNEIRKIVKAHEESNGGLDLSKPEVLTDNEFRYFTTCEILQNTIDTLRMQLTREEEKLANLISDSEYYSLNEGI
jgi:hypothetical protein